MDQVLLFFGVILYTIVFLWIGFRAALLRWNHRENSEKLDNYEILNKQLVEVNEKQVESINTNNANIKKTNDWYLLQLQSISTYIKEQHGDSKLQEHLGIMIGNPKIEFKEEIDYNINEILEKITKLGISSLTKDELDFLKDNEDNK